MNDKQASGPLAGVKVIDLTSVIMGPLCTQILADMGARVIKVEGADGDSLRALPPARGGSEDGASFQWLNRGKESVVIDLKTPEGRDLCLQLASDADLVIHSMRPQAIEKLELGFNAFAAVNPGVVYCNLYGFGRGGRYAGMAAYDDTIQAVSGLAMLQKEMLGEPSYIANVVADKVCGITAVYAVLAALLHKQKTGEGQEVDVPMFETMASFVLVEHLGGYLYQPPVGRPVYARATSPGRKPYKTLDGYVSVLVYNDKQVRAFARLLGDEQMLADPRFRSLKDRTHNVAAWCDAVESHLCKRTTAEWLLELQKIGIPAIRLNSTEDLFSDPHLEDVAFFEEVDDVVRGPLRMPRPPVIFSKTPSHTGSAGSLLGADTVHVLTEAGLDTATIATLRQSGVIGTRHAAHPPASEQETP